MIGGQDALAELLDRTRRGQRAKFLFFWGHQAERDGSIGRGCLSQWWPAPFVVDGRRFGSAEHYMMWRKAVLFDDEASAEQILATSSPRQVKTLGRGVTGFEQSRWEAHRYEIVRSGSVAKFGQNAELGAFLHGTGNRILVEASPLDRVWGIGLGADDPKAKNPAQWRGLNLLGFALVEAREILAT